MTYLSRAKRLTKCMDDITLEKDKAQDLRDGVEEWKDGEEDPTSTIIVELVLSLDVAEIESLRDEITSWRENIEEKLSQTQKYSDLEECEQALEECVSKAEEVIEKANAVDFSKLYLVPLPEPLPNDKRDVWTHSCGRKLDLHSVNPTGPGPCQYHTRRIVKTPEEADALIESLDDFIEACDELDSEVSNVSFPGMY